MNAVTLPSSRERLPATVLFIRPLNLIMGAISHPSRIYNQGCERLSLFLSSGVQHSAQEIATEQKHRLGRDQSTGRNRVMAGNGTGATTCVYIVRRTKWIPLIRMCSNNRERSANGGTVLEIQCSSHRSHCLMTVAPFSAKWVNPPPMGR